MLLVLRGLKSAGKRREKPHEFDSSFTRRRTDVHFHQRQFAPDSGTEEEPENWDQLQLLLQT